MCLGAADLLGRSGRRIVSKQGRADGILDPSPRRRRDAIDRRTRRVDRGRIDRRRGGGRHAGLAVAGRGRGLAGVRLRRRRGAHRGAGGSEAGSEIGAGARPCVKRRGTVLLVAAWVPAHVPSSVAGSLERERGNLDGPGPALSTARTLCRRRTRWRSRYLSQCGTRSTGP